MHVVLIESSDYFLSLFLQVELSHFSGISYNKVNGQGIPCGHNSSYSFILILSKLHWCFSYGLKICMWFWYNPQNILCCFFLQVELSHFFGIIYNKVNGQGIPCGRNSSYNFISIILKLHWCFGHGLKICMWFWYNPQIFCSFFRKLNLVFFGALYITKWMDRGYLVGATPPTVLYRFFRNFTGVLVMVCRYACGFPAFFPFSAINIINVYIYVVAQVHILLQFIQYFKKHLYVLMS